MDFTVIKRAGLSQLEFSKLTGVSRVTTNLWVRSKMSPHRYIKARIGQVIECVQAAIEAGDLPVPEATPALKRLPLARQAIQSAALRLKDAVAPA